MRALVRILLIALVLASAGLTMLPARVARAAPPPAVNRNWLRTDYPVFLNRISRTWMWGPNQIHTDDPVTEPYLESPNGQRSVYYFDKARMEVTDPNADDTSIWYVTNGLLVRELVTGQMQVGNNSFENWLPAEVNVAGDADDLGGPTYATFLNLLNAPPAANGALITQRVNRLGQVTNDGSLAGRNVTAAYNVVVPGLNHQVASPFWAFMNSEGEIYENGAFKQARLFVDPFYATGYPITEAYWADVKVAGTIKLVLMQCFERRCLTYTPDNPDGWKVEAGNVGQHYYAWRYAGVAGKIVYQPDLTLLEEVHDGYYDSYYDPGLSCWILEDSTPLAASGDASGYTVSFPHNIILPRDFSLSVTIVTLNSDTTYQSEAGLNYRFSTVGGQLSTTSTTVLGMDGVVASYYQHLQTGDIILMDNTALTNFKAGYGAENTFEVIVKGTQATVYVNQRFVHSFVLNSNIDLTSNGIGFVIYRISPGDQPVTRFGFKNLIMRELLNP